MQKNLISIYQFSTNDHVSIEFSPSIFQVKDLNTGAILLMGEPKDGVWVVDYIPLCYLFTVACIFQCQDHFIQVAL